MTKFSPFALAAVFALTANDYANGFSIGRSRPSLMKSLQMVCFAAYLLGISFFIYIKFSWIGLSLLRVVPRILVLGFGLKFNMTYVLMFWIESFL